MFTHEFDDEPRDPLEPHFDDPRLGQSEVVGGVELSKDRRHSVYLDGADEQTKRLDAFYELTGERRSGQVEHTFVFGYAVEARFDKLLARFTKTCARWGQKIEVLNRTTRDFPSPYVKGETIRRIEVTISIPPIAGEKGRVLGMFEKAEDGQSFYIQVTDEAYRAEVEALKVRAGECDHCGSNRDRRNTFVCETTDGVKLIGKSCLKDFFGVDPARCLGFWEGRNNFLGDCGGPSREEFIGLDELLTVSYRVARKLGGYLKGTSGKHVSLLIWGDRSTYKETREENKKIIDSYKGFEPEFDKEAFSDYVLGLRRDGGFNDNLRTALAQQDYVSVKRVGLIIAAVGLSVSRLLRLEETAETRQAEAEAQAARPAPKLFDAPEGKRIDFEGEVVRTYVYQSDYGATCIVSIRCDDGSALVNFHTGANRPEAGKRYAIRATIKRHGVNKRDNTPETTLSRAVYTPVDTSQGALI